MFSRLSIPPEGVAILNLVQAAFSPNGRVIETLPSPLDWNFLLRLARHHRLEPLLSYGLRRSHFGGVPAVARAWWDTCRRDAVIGAFRHQKALGTIAGEFEARRIPYILLKGEALSKAFYPDEGLRPYGDIDLLVRPEHYEPAKASLFALGFQLREPNEEVGQRRIFGEMEFYTEEPHSLVVDLHWDTLMTVWEPRSLFTDHDTWAAPDYIRLGNRAIPILRREVLLVFLCVHLAFHHVFDGLLFLADLFLVLTHTPERIDWDRLMAIANRCQCRTALYYSLIFAHALMAAPVPSGVLDRLRPPALVRALMPTSRLLFRDTLAPKMLERHVKFLLIDSLEGRWRALRVWLNVMSKGV